MEVSDLNKLLKMHRQMSDMMKKLGKGKGGMMKKAMQAMMGKGGMDPAALAQGMDPKALEAAAKQMGGTGKLPGLGGGMSLPPWPVGFWEEEVNAEPFHHRTNRRYMITPIGHTTIQIPTFQVDDLILRAPQMSDLDMYAEFCASDRSKGRWRSL